MTNTILFPAAVILKRRTCERYINSPAGPKSPRGAIGSSMPPQMATKSSYRTLFLLRSRDEAVINYLAALLVSARRAPTCFTGFCPPVRSRTPKRGTSTETSLYLLTRKTSWRRLTIFSTVESKISQPVRIGAPAAYRTAPTMRISR